MKRPVPQKERGAALLAVLLLVAVMGALSAAALQRLRLSTSLAANISALDQARNFAVGVESLLILKIDDLLALNAERTTLAGGWNGETRRLPMPGGAIAEATLRDGGNCFNINSVAEGIIPTELTPRPAGVAQFVALMRVLGVPEAEARRIGDGAGDWVDADQNRSRDGAEDAAYAGAGQGYLTGATMFADVSELRAVSGMTPEIYERIRPWLCALPTTELSGFNINTLTVEQAPLVAMLAPERIGLDAARQVIALRPATGWNSLLEFYAAGPLAGVELSVEAQLQPQLRTRWFKIELLIEVDRAELFETALIDARISPAKVATRQWGSRD